MQAISRGCWRAGVRATGQRSIGCCRSSARNWIVWPGVTSAGSDRTSRCSLPLWCRKHFSGFCLAPNVAWQDRAHFFAVASHVMRHVLVDYARGRLRQKRGGGAVHIPIDAAVVLSSQQVEQVVAVDLALQRLANSDERKSQVFEMRFFGGLTVEEVAEALGVSPNTVIRDWNFARAWLRRELGGGKRADSGPPAPH